MIRPTSRLLMRASNKLNLHATARRSAVSEKSAGTTRIHFQKLKNIPVEVYPLGVIVTFMVSYGLFAMGKALLVGDPTLRTRRQVWKNTEN